MRGTWGTHFYRLGRVAKSNRGFFDSSLWRLAQNDSAMVAWFG
jgi:hypothetical protein